MWRVAVRFFDEGGCYAELAFAEEVHGDSAIYEQGM
jgi:hypothetical protein